MAVFTEATPVALMDEGVSREEDDVSGAPAVFDVEFIVLGSGTSAGVPVIGCECAVCSSDDPRDARSRCSAAVRFVDADGDERIILIDTSPDLRQQVLRHQFTRCDGILYTHNHVDHTFGLDDVRRFNALMDAPIELYAEPRTLEHLFRVYRHIFQSERNVNVSFVATLVPHELDPIRPLDLHGLRFTPVRFLHGRLPVLGYRIEALNDANDVAFTQPGPLPVAWCTDVSSVPPESWARLNGLRTLFLDMLRYRQHPTHLSVEQAIEIAERIDAVQTRFIHMTHDILHRDLDARLPDGMALAHDGMILR